MLVVLAALPAWAGQGLTIIYLSRQNDPAYQVQVQYTGLKLRERKPPLPGAAEAVKGAAILGRARGLAFSLDPVELAADADAVVAIRKLAEDKAPAVFLLDLPFDDIVKAARAFAQDPGIVLFNIRSRDDRLRGADCSPALFDIIPSQSMLTDALAQHMVQFHWKRILVLAGTTDADQRDAAAFRRSARKFGLDIVAERKFTLGHDPQQREANNIALLTGGVDYDAIFLADSYGEFGRYLPYATTLPRPVAGSEGLKAAAWDWTWERNGAPQLNDRIRRLAHRNPSPEDWAAWMAVRVAVQAAVDTGGTDPATLRARMRDPAFTVDMYKIGPGSFRAWDNQLRQPILLHTGNAVISVAPFEGFLHQFNSFDSLGADQPESVCHM